MQMLKTCRKIIVVLLVLSLVSVAIIGCNDIKKPTEPETDPLPTELTTLPGLTDNTFGEEDFEETPTNPVTEPEEIHPTEKPVTPTEPTDPKEEETQPPVEETQPPTKPTDESQPPEMPTEPEQQLTEYEWYEALSPEEQVAYYETFESMEAFVKWYNAAKAEYDRLHPPIEGGDGEVDLGEITGGNNG